MDGLGLGQGLVDGPERRDKAARSWVMVDKIDGLEGPRVLDGPQGGTETAGEREEFDGCKDFLLDGPQRGKTQQKCPEKARDFLTASSRTHSRARSASPPHALNMHPHPTNWLRLTTPIWPLHLPLSFLTRVWTSQMSQWHLIPPLPWPWTLVQSLLFHPLNPYLTFLTLSVMGPLNPTTKH